MDNIKKINIFEQLLTKEELEKSNNINKITDKIYLGDIEGATNFHYFKNEQIHNVISIVNEPPQYPKEMKINHISFKLEDKKTNNILKYFKECIYFIENSDKIYIHCLFGISRSPTIVIAYLMWKTHSNFEDIYKYIKTRRSIIEPNKGFIQQLKEFDNILKINNYELSKIDFNSFQNK